MISINILMIYREVKNKEFIYRNSNQSDIERISKLNIPPAWTNVEISKNPKKDLQVTGYDSKGRKQYLYSKEYIEKTKNKKFKKINSIDYDNYKEIIDHNINKKNLSRENIICNILKLMEDLNIRVGNESYKKHNGSYGITTLLKSHLKDNKLCFIGKKGIYHEKKITEKKSKDFLIKMLKIKGPNLFNYSDNVKVTSKDLNDFLQSKIDKNISCKDIRTYSANKMFLGYMKNYKLCKTQTERKKKINEAIDFVANELGNTRKICKESYINPKNIKKFI